MAGSSQNDSGHTEAEMSIGNGSAPVGSPGSTREAASATVPITVAGQKHVSPPGRHSQQKHRLAAARAEALGLTTVRELYDHDRSVVLAKLQKTSDGKLAQQRNEQNRRSGTPNDKT